MRLYNFKDMVGNVNTISLIKQTLKNNALQRVTILTGPAGTGKSTTAEIMSLYLTCSNPKDGEPCLECTNCKRILEALKTQEPATLRFVKKNMAEKTTHKDLDEVKEELFVLKPSDGNNVYVMEELHILDEKGQTSFLERIDRLSSNSYIIICTTEENKIIKPLRSRSRIFSFKRLNKTEAKFLADKVCKSIGMVPPESKIFDLLYEYSGGIQRDLTNALIFINESKPNREQLLEHLNIVDSKVFTDLLYSFGENKISGISSIKNIFDNFSSKQLIPQFQNYILNCIFYVDAGITGTLSKTDIKFLKENMNSDKLYKIASAIKDLNQNSSDKTFQFQLLKVMKLINMEHPKTILTKNSNEVSKQVITAENNSKKINKDKLEVSSEVKTISSIEDFVDVFK